MLFKDEDDGDYGKRLGVHGGRDVVYQTAISAALGLSAFLLFCFLRPRWSGLYAARKKQRGQASPLPNLPNTFFGWIPVLWRITDQQILASAGLDAYVFLRFFRLAIKFISVTLFFALVVVKPVHDAYPDASDKIGKNTTHNDTKPSYSQLWTQLPTDDIYILGKKGDPDSFYDMIPNDYMWMYLIFAYMFSGLAIYLMTSETEKIIDIRQSYLGTQSTVTDRTFRLSGIPSKLQDEALIKQFVEGLEIGKVDSVMLCRNWEELDNAMDRRQGMLRKLEEAWTVYLGRRRVERNSETLPIVQPPPPEPVVQSEGDEEADALLGSGVNGSDDPMPYARHRPKVTIRYGYLGLRSRYVDGIDYYEEHLRLIDEEIKVLRKKTFKPTPIAFVTMESVASCQMAVQAVLNSSPRELLAHASPAPADVVWRNTYLPRRRRMISGWTITLIITFLTIFWSILLVPIAGALNTTTIGKVFPNIAKTLEDHSFVAYLVNTQLPTLLVTLLFVAVPYLYDFLANRQGMISQGDVELSVITKNFFFTFFNYFVVFTLLSAFSNFYTLFKEFQDTLKDTTKLAFTMATSLQKTLGFYTNLVVLQGLGLFPLRMLQIGSVLLYPIYRMGAKTPRDYAELVQPSVFNYGFYLPQVMLIFIICIVYSVLRDSWRILLAGLVYFILGAGVYKYQLLYSMDHRQHSTGRAWIIICNRTVIGMLLFQISVAGQLALKGAFTRAALTVPLLLVTVWFSYYFTRVYAPLMKFIALRSIERQSPAPYATADALPDDPDGWNEQAHWRYEAETRPGNTVDESDESGIRYMNPSLYAPLQNVWIADSTERDATVQPSSPRARLTTMINAL